MGEDKDEIYKDEWLDTLIGEVGGILKTLATDWFMRYRRIGKLILTSGYEKGQWHSRHKTRFIKELGVSQSLFSVFVRLGEMNDKKFGEVTDTFGSVNEWYKQGNPKTMSKARKNLQKSLITNFGGMAREIKEICRIDKPYLKEKELEDFSKKVFYGREDPITVFIKYFMFARQSKVKIPNWIVSGFEALLEQQESDQPVDGTILAKLSEILKEEGITDELITVHMTSKLREEWGIN